MKRYDTEQELRETGVGLLLWKQRAEKAEARVAKLEAAIGALPCACYDEPTLAPTDIVREIRCARCAALEDSDADA